MCNCGRLSLAATGLPRPLWQENNPPTPDRSPADCFRKRSIGYIWFQNEPPDRSESSVWRLVACVTGKGLCLYRQRRLLICNRIDYIIAFIGKGIECL